MLTTKFAPCDHLSTYAPHALLSIMLRETCLIGLTFSIAAKLGHTDQSGPKLKQRLYRMMKRFPNRGTLEHLETKWTNWYIVINWGSINQSIILIFLLINLI